MKLTFTAPHILLAIEQDGLFIKRTIREGGGRQLEFETVHEYVDAPVEEPVFSIKVTNQVNFGGQVFNVINDEVLLENGFRLVPTVPTAAEYMALVGTKVQVGFRCVKEPAMSKEQGKDVFRVTRISTTLP